MSHSQHALIQPQMEYVKLYNDNHLTVYQYSKLLHQALISEKCITYYLMDLCVKISFFVTSPNESIYQYELQKYSSILYQFFYPNIAELIISFIINKSKYLQWVHFTDFQSTENNLYFTEMLKSRHLRYEKQLKYSNNNSIINFANPTQNYLNVRTDLLDINTKYFLNIYCFEKKDEIWLGLVSKSGYHPAQSCRKYTNGLFYYGGRESRIEIYGGDINSKCCADCNEFMEYDYYKSNRDCNHGSIQGSDIIIKHPLPSYGKGDWINFEIDSESKCMVFYKNGTEQYRLSNTENIYFPKGECYFIVEVDRRRDKFYIEQSYNFNQFFE